MALRCARVIGNRKIEARQSAEIATTRRTFGINQIPISWIYDQSTRKRERKLSVRMGCEGSAERVPVLLVGSGQYRNAVASGQPYAFNSSSEIRNVHPTLPRCGTDPTQLDQDPRPMSRYRLALALRLAFAFALALSAATFSMFFTPLTSSTDFATVSARV